jgi:hypothetical protein
MAPLARMVVRAAQSLSSVARDGSPLLHTPVAMLAGYIPARSAAQMPALLRNAQTYE